MNGFRNELIDKIVGFNAHVIVDPYEKQIDQSKLNDNNLQLISNDLIFSSNGEAVLLNKDFTKGIILRGYKKEDFTKLKIINNKNFIGVKNNLTGNNISIGKELSFSLNLKIGDKVSVMSSTGVETIIGNLPKQQTFIVNSIFDSGFSEFDHNVAFINLDFLEDFFDLSERSRNLEIYLKNPSDIENSKNIVQSIFKDQFIYTWSDMNSSLFSALKVERNVMFIILSLIIIVAAFNIISGLTILVKNKTREIAILKSIGVLNKSIIKIFFLVGVIIGSSATLFGIIIGITFSIYIEKVRTFLSNIFNISLFPEEIYFLSKMPSEINFFSIFIISICSIIITIIVSIFPAVKASKLDPVKSLKYE
jgi:lipoprotein-releasing system permease protein